MKKKRRWYWYLGLVLVIAWVVSELVTLRIFSYPLEIAQDHLRGGIYVATKFAVLGVGVWLMIKK